VLLGCASCCGDPGRRLVVGRATPGHARGHRGRAGGGWWPLNILATFFVAVAAMYALWCGWPWGRAAAIGLDVVGGGLVEASFRDVPGCLVLLPAAETIGIGSMAPCHARPQSGRLGVWRTAVGERQHVGAGRFSYDHSRSMCRPARATAAMGFLRLLSGTSGCNLVAVDALITRRGLDGPSELRSHVLATRLREQPVIT